MCICLACFFFWNFNLFYIYLPEESKSRKRYRGLEFFLAIVRSPETYSLDTSALCSSYRMPKINLSIPLKNEN